MPAQITAKPWTTNIERQPMSFIVADGIRIVRMFAPNGFRTIKRHPTAGSLTRGQPGGCLLFAAKAMRACLAGLLDMALREYKQCMAHDEEIAIPDGLPQELLGLLRHGRDLALDRASVVHEAIAVTSTACPSTRCRRSTTASTKTARKPTPRVFEAL
ncbi:hypothetical protein HYPDE_26318 [Hyphomicrobium denitrificans 1NES1]|uniref:Uncharacterized protein n=1 Tax=Hyphomicrobium denitrificans 1NES1 TaxID=670307 RepID=N0B8T2_9HYPH|nr:hypothetical protein [Hyphomicrobium denitrificans]AGK56946.1 hypothetical protein HYPDE_26318 [Hyphomicrobium denitrificans 1NES1]